MRALRGSGGKKPSRARVPWRALTHRIGRCNGSQRVGSPAIERDCGLQAEGRDSNPRATLPPTTVFETPPKRPQCRITTGVRVPGEFRGEWNPPRVRRTHRQRAWIQNTSRCSQRVASRPSARGSSARCPRGTLLRASLRSPWGNRVRCQGADEAIHVIGHVDPDEPQEGGREPLVAPWSCRMRPPGRSPLSGRRPASPHRAAPFVTGSVLVTRGFSFGVRSTASKPSRMSVRPTSATTASLPAPARARSAVLSDGLLLWHAHAHQLGP
jgi:hypothetical protein